MMEQQLQWAQQEMQRLARQNQALASELRRQERSLPRKEEDANELMSVTGRHTHHSCGSGMDEGIGWWLMLVLAGWCLHC